MIEKFLEIIAGWDKLGQWLFLAFCVFILAVSIVDVFKYIAVWIHGWPPLPVSMPDEQQEEHEEES